MKKIKSTLYNLNKKGKIKLWEVFVKESNIYVKYGLEGGKLQEKITVAKPKNLGKSNYTSAEEQAFKEAISKWNKQKDRKGYVEDKNVLFQSSPKDINNDIKQYPMLALNGSKNKKAIKFPCQYSYKLNGLRTLVIAQENEEVIPYSRGLMPYNLPAPLMSEISSLYSFEIVDRYLDGEIYINGFYLQDINSAVKNDSHPDRDKLKIIIFDIPKANKEWQDRFKDLEVLKDNTSDFKRIEVIEYKTAYDWFELQQALDSSIQEGYEGLVIRNLNGLYEFNHRSRNMIKLKLMHSSEALITQVSKDKNEEGVLHCNWTNTNNQEVQFKCKLEGDHHSRSFDNCQLFINKWVTFNYQELTKEGKPSLPVGIAIRKMDSNSLQPLE